MSREKLADGGNEVETADIGSWSGGFPIIVEHLNRKQKMSVAGRTERAGNKMLHYSTRPDYVTVVCGGLKMARNSLPLLT